MFQALKVRPTETVTTTPLQLFCNNVYVFRAVNGNSSSVCANQAPGRQKTGISYIRNFFLGTMYHSIRCSTSLPTLCYRRSIQILNRSQVASAKPSPKSNATITYSCPCPVERRQHGFSNCLIPAPYRAEANCARSGSHQTSVWRLAATA